MRPSLPRRLVNVLPITGVNRHCFRQLHCSARCAKNPYFFYDLQRQQGSPANDFGDAHFDKNEARSAINHRVFNPLKDQPLESMEQRVSKVFGAMGSRDESRKVAQQLGVTVAGTHVPARPEEPTNCCMSGCINCVWELYKDELEEYRALRNLAREKLNAPQYDHVAWPRQLGKEPKDRLQRLGKSSNASASNLAPDPSPTGDEGDDPELSEGIKVFIATEKRLHEKRQRAKAV